MKVINILGSPRRKGTSARIAQSFAEAAESHGAEVESYYLNGMQFKGCQGCEKCHTGRESCALKDDLTPVLEGLHEADVAVFSSPVYYGDTSGQFKMFLDRTWSLVKPEWLEDLSNASRLPKGKTALFILSQGAESQRHEDVVKRYSEFLTLYGYDLKVIWATGLVTGAVDADVSKEQAEASELAVALCNGS